MKKIKQNLRPVIALALILTLICALMTAGIFSRYQTVKMIANKVDYKNTLAESFQLLDQPITENEDGSYSKDESDEAEPTDGYTFRLIPGITIPAAPYIEITGKTEIPAYLYLEVENTADIELSFDEKWTLLDDVSGKKGGDVYAYDNGTAMTGEGDDTTLTIETFTVPEALSREPDELTEGSIKVYAYLLQKVGDKSAEDTYNSAPAL